MTRITLALALILATLAPLGATGAQAGEVRAVVASWYGAKYKGRPTASGEPFDPKAFTAAHPSLPFGTLVEVRRWDDGRSVLVRVNDRGPSNGRGIDLSEAAARHIGLTLQGTGWVTLHPVREIAGLR